MLIVVSLVSVQDHPGNLHGRRGLPHPRVRELHEHAGTEYLMQFPGEVSRGVELRARSGALAAMQGDEN